MHSSSSSNSNANFAAIPGGGGGANGKKGLGRTLAAFFLVADMSIAGMLALPAAIFNAQFYPGLAIFLSMALISGLSAFFLGRCWEMLLLRFPAAYSRVHCRKPYAEIGYRAFGLKMKHLVSVCVNLTQFGAATVFLLLCAKNTRHFLLHSSSFPFPDVGICPLILFFAVLLWPLTLLKSPNDFWPLLFGGIFCTVATFLLICADSLLALASNNHRPTGMDFIPKFNAYNYLSAAGTILFAFGGHPAIPTIQHDMEKPGEFGKSAALGFGTITVFNLIVVILASFAYGPGLEETIVNSLQMVWIRQSVIVLTTANSLLSIILVINPLNQEAEELFGVPQAFGWQRVTLRSAILFFILFVAQSAPSFGPMLNFFAGSTIAMTSLIFPWLFHYKLTRDENGEEKGMNEGEEADERGPSAAASSLPSCWWNGIRIPIAIYAIVIVFAVLIGIFVTFSAVRELISVQFVTPCYLRLLL